MSDVKPIQSKKDLAEEAMQQLHFTFDHMYSGQVLPLRERWFWKAILHILDYLMTK